MIAQYNIALPLWPKGDPRMAEFFDNIERINGLADRSPGFVWRLPEGTPGEPVFPDQPGMTWTISVWQDLDALRHFTWNTLHKRFRLRRAEWFVPLDGPYLALWPIAPDHRPLGAEAQAMLAKLAAEGPSDAVFGTHALTPEPA